MAERERALEGGRCVGVPPFRALELAELMQRDEPLGLVEGVHGPLLRKPRREGQPLASPRVVAAEHARQGGAGLRESEMRPRYGEIWPRSGEIWLVRVARASSASPRAAWSSAKSTFSQRNASDS